ncbi:MAG TPA: ankyrin repeat domain-containing protein [Bryobacteraceae bacterium]|nr:ankyrin repeat domain-containing protein [Bryobacteraceae bacterium]
MLGIVNTSHSLKDAIVALREGNLEALRAAIAADPELARQPRLVVAAGGRAMQPALALLKKAGADLNASWRNYRALHALLQEEPHAAAGKPAPARLACLEWLLAHGADPEQLGAWPSARAIIVAAFVGSPEYVKALRKGGAKMDGFAGAALGDRKLVEKTLRARPDFARDRDHDGLTALQCAAGSRMPKADTLGIARLLIDAGAEVGALTKSWAQHVNPAYFAAGRKNKPMFDLLLDSGADPTDALSRAAWAGAYELAASALEHGAAIDRATANGKPLLNDLIRWGQIPQMSWLLDHKASPNVPDERGWTAVHQAASRGNMRMLRAVLGAGGDPTRRDKEGRLPQEVTLAAKLAEVLAVK